MRKEYVAFGPYVLLERVAVGGMAEVYLSKSFGIAGFERFVAIKRILPDVAEEDDFIHMFIDEAVIAGKLNHANICPIYELGKVGESHYMAMEYVWGRDLLQVMNRFRRRREVMPPDMAAWIGSKICEGLDYAHRKNNDDGSPLNLVHRDMSPQNILVSYDGEIKIIDFGIARAASRTSRTRAGMLKGKFGYMSPEQARGEEIDQRSDLFAVGTCMYEMLTCERLFLGDGEFSTLERVKSQEVKPLREVVPSIPAELEDIVLRALERDLDGRFQSARQIQEQLLNFLAKQAPPFGTGTLGQWMEEAFAPEISEEKRRHARYGQLDRASVEAMASHGSDPIAGEVTHISEVPLTGHLASEPTEVFFRAPEYERPASLAGHTSLVERHAHIPGSGSVSGVMLKVPERTSDTGSLDRVASNPGSVRSSRARWGRGTWLFAMGALVLVSSGLAYLMLREPPTGTLMVRTVPAVSAEVKIDGVVRGRSPLHLRHMAPGVHQVEARLQGYLNATARVTVESGRTSVAHIQMESAPR